MDMNYGIRFFQPISVVIITSAAQRLPDKCNGIIAKFEAQFAGTHIGDGGNNVEPSGNMEGPENYCFMKNGRLVTIPNINQCIHRCSLFVTVAMPSTLMRRANHAADTFNYHHSNCFIFFIFCCYNG